MPFPLFSLAEFERSFSLLFLSHVDVNLSRHASVMIPRLSPWRVQCSAGINPAFAAVRYCSGSGRSPFCGMEQQQSDVEAEQQDVAVGDEVVAAFRAHPAGLARRLLAAQGDEVVVGDGLGADEALLEVGVDDARRRRCLRSAAGSSRRGSPSDRR